MTTHLYLIRHAEAFPPGGNNDLSPLGLMQAECLRDCLATTQKIAADVLISSTMIRASRTAEIIAPAVGLPITFDEEIEEWHIDTFEDLPEHEKTLMYKSSPISQWPFLRLVPNAETWAEFNVRVGVAFERITREHRDKTIMVICHAGVIESLFLFFFGLSSLQFPRILMGHTKHASITHWQQNAVEEIGLPPTWSLERYNDVAHVRYTR